MNDLDKDINSYVDDYDSKVDEELELKRRLRREKAKHQTAIARCNVLLACEIFVLAILVIALIVNIL